MTIVAVCVYNRIENIKHWINCFQQSNTDNAELVIIHNYYGDEKEKEKFQSLCQENEIRYVPRNKQGADLGAFQDVCLERLTGFPDQWDYLLWCTDDCLPMSKNFLTPFIEKLQDENNGVSCMQISKSSPRGIFHVRTTGFCISKEISKRLIWPVDPILNKHHCYLLEHTGGSYTISEQIRAMGLNCVQVAPIRNSPLWDSAHPNRRLRLHRHYEFNNIWQNSLLSYL